MSDDMPKSIWAGRRDGYGVWWEHKEKIFAKSRVRQDLLQHYLDQKY